ncbi:MAG: hypothetical protein U5L95_02525 [Candidatus Saccharibacteria bacterium]|nr:hypothetical protein [Candidatus Saccharibacteria bacterium]
MKTIQLVVSLEFDNKITDDEEIKEVVENTLSALSDRAENGFISPVENENVGLTKIVVSEQFTETTMFYIV